MHKLASKFIKPAIIQEHKSKKLSFAKLDVCVENQRDDISLGIGPLTRNTIKRLLDSGEVDQEKVDQFFDSVRALFMKAYEYCVQCMRNCTRCEKIKGEVSVAIEVVIRFDRHQL
jgi:hypothetical protein